MAERGAPWARVRISGAPGSGALWLSLVLVGVLVLAALFGPWLAPFDPVATEVRNALAPPSWRHPFGTDHLGRDVASRVLVAARLDLGIALAAVVVSALAGTAVGALAGWRGGWADAMTGRGVDVLLALPLFLLAMLLVLSMGNRVAVVVVATAVVNLPFYIRLVRGEVALRRRSLVVQAARVGGSGDLRCLRVFVLPAVLPLVAVQASVNLGWAMLNAAGLSFLGIGVRPPTAEWGIMLAEGARFLSSGQWWMAGFPALALVGSVLGFHLLGDGLRDRLARGQGG